MSASRSLLAASATTHQAPWSLCSPSAGVVDFSSSATMPPERRRTRPSGDQSVEGLQMDQGGRRRAEEPGHLGPARAAAAFEHRPVMLREVLEVLREVPPGLVVDATVGGGGHAAALLAARPDLSVVGLDQDPDALAAARATLAPFGPRVRLLQARFDDRSALEDAVGTEEVVAWCFDLGVSSPQLDRAERGFSYRLAGPLDMRMDPGRPGPTAAELVNEWPPERLAAIFAESGETRLAGRLARAVVAARPLHSTAELAAVVERAVPAGARRRGHPARRVFQALRMAVNDELGALGRALPAALARLAPGGRCVVLSYHSGEDRLVKAVFQEAATGGCRCPSGLPCVCGAVPLVRL
ncbi:16S rRNA (cytosine(1402)-N(4))-methyltransferase RsmH, partial [Aciditerrimonas ferrireducens]